MTLILIVLLFSLVFCSWLCWNSIWSAGRFELVCVPIEVANYVFIVAVGARLSKTPENDDAIIPPLHRLDWTDFIRCCDLNHYYWYVGIRWQLSKCYSTAEMFWMNFCHSKQVIRRMCPILWWDWHFWRLERVCQRPCPASLSQIKGMAQWASAAQSAQIPLISYFAWEFHGS